MNAHKKRTKDGKKTKKALECEIVKNDEIFLETGKEDFQPEPLQYESS